MACACGNRLNVPTLRGIRQLELAPADAKTKSSPGWSRTHGVVFASGLLVAGLGLFLISTYLWRYAQIGGTGLTVDRSAEVTTAMTGEIDKLTPVQALEMWTTEILPDGLGQAHAPIWVAAKGKLAEFLWWIKLGGLLLVAGIFLSTGALCVGRGSR